MPEINGGMHYSASDVPTINQIIRPSSTEQVEDLWKDSSGCKDLSASRFWGRGTRRSRVPARAIYELVLQQRTDKYGGSFENRMLCHRSCRRIAKLAAINLRFQHQCRRIFMVFRKGPSRKRASRLRRRWSAAALMPSMSVL